MKISRKETIGVLATAVIALFAISLPGTASAKDQNKDRIPDRWERSHKLSLNKDQRKLDQDRDGLKNRGEWRAGTSPRDKDSDGDGVSDLKEKAGVISAFDAETGELTLTLYAGGELSGSVTDETRIRCQSGVGEEEGTEESAERRGGIEDEGGPRDENQEQGQGPPGHGGPGHGGPGERDKDCGGDCSVEDLAEGVEITEAVVQYTASGKVFRELEIVSSAVE